MANEELDKAIPSGDMTRIRNAHDRTQGAERAVEEASEELEVVGELLSEDDKAERPDSASASGDGVQSLLKSLRSTRKE